MRGPIEKEIAKRQAEVDDLTRQLAVATEVLASLKEILKKIPQDNAGVQDRHHGQKAELRAGSDLARVKAAILEAGKPLHVTELLAALGKPNTKANRVSLSGSLGTYVRKDQFFTRPAPNVFGVIGLQIRPPFVVEDSLPVVKQ